MECLKCGAPLFEDNQCCDGGKCCKECCQCEDGVVDEECGCV